MEILGILMLVFCSAALLAFEFVRTVTSGVRSYEERILAGPKVRPVRYAAFISPDRLTVLQAASALAFAMAGFVAASQTPLPVPFIAMVVTGAVGVFIPGAILGVLEKKRKKLFNDQLVDAMNTVANGIKSGFSFQQALALAARQLPDPCGQEFRITIRQASLGLRLNDALENMVARVEDGDLELMTTAVRLTFEIGGDLADVLHQLSETILERRRIDGKIDSLTSQGRLQAIIVGLVPFALAFVVHMVNPELMRPMYTTTTGFMLLAGVMLLDFLGFMMIRRIVTIKE